MNVPSELRYTASHEWVRPQADGSVLVGITDFAQESLGDVVFVELPAVGKSFPAGQAIAVVESVKAASDIYAPIGGSVTAVNEALKDAPEEINRDAFGAWLFRLQPDDPAQIATLLDAAAYAAQAEAQK